MQPTEPRSLTDYFKEGLRARQDGLALGDNPYSAGSDKRREWAAGFRATFEARDGDDAVGFEPGESGRGDRNR
ncbi:hypothetical protein [Lichenibacterium ramalinae]|nr:hypothetical protein [Lichenibacterium ramalinae]